MSPRARRLFALGTAVVGGAVAAELAFSEARVGALPPPPTVTPERPPILPRLPGEKVALPPELGGRRELVVIFFVDGISDAQFRDATQRGELPNLARLAASRPSWTGTARGSFPTSTAPTIPEVLTGSWSDRLGGMPDNIHALDRQEGRLVRYEIEAARWDGSALTLFDRVAGEGGVTLTYFEGYFPGASITVHDELVYLLDTAVVKAREDAVLRYDERMVEDLRRRLQAAKQAPNLIFVRLGAVDTAGHFYGPDSSSTAAAIRAVDRSVAQVLEALDDTPLADGRTAYEAANFLFFSDHGMAQTTQRVDLDAALRELGLDPFPTSDPRALAASILDPEALLQSDAVAVPDGSDVAAIYLRAWGSRETLPWSKVPPYGAVHAVRGQDLVEHLLGFDGVLRVHERSGDNTVTVRGRGGMIEVQRRFTPEGAAEYALLVEGEEPFGVCAGPPCCPKESAGDACFLSAPDWRRATLGWEIPELPRLLWKVFDGPPARRPDLLVEAAPGYGFMGQAQGDHGRLDPELARVPLMVAGPAVNPAANPLDPRLIDLVPSLLPLLGLGTAQGLDGEDLGFFVSPTGG